MKMEYKLQGIKASPNISKKHMAEKFNPDGVEASGLKTDIIRPVF
jgi:hypothetical protein